MVHEFQNFDSLESFEIREPQIKLRSYLLLTLGGKIKKSQLSKEVKMLALVLGYALD